MRTIEPACNKANQQYAFRLHHTISYPCATRQPNKTIIQTEQTPKTNNSSQSGARTTKHQHPWKQTQVLVVNPVRGDVEVKTFSSGPPVIVVAAFIVLLTVAWDERDGGGWQLLILAEAWSW